MHINTFALAILVHDVNIYKMKYYTPAVQSLLFLVNLKSPPQEHVNLSPLLLHFCAQPPLSISSHGCTKDKKL